MNEMTSIISSLNPRQKQACLSLDRHTLVIAGAGSGKTKTLTARLYHIISKNLCPLSGVIALTFTNKAAKEMKERLATMIKVDKSIFVGTFHSWCLRFLREYASYAGYSNNFLIYDEDDRGKIIKDILEVSGETTLNDKEILSKISNWKNSGANSSISGVGSSDSEFIQAVCDEYLKTMKSRNAMDFDDILLVTLNILNNNKSLLSKYPHHLMVDEYQDTNLVQLEILKLLASYGALVFAVGDDDQSIYAWRGADTDRLLKFQDDFPNSEIIKLEQNYRSTKQILDFSNFVISKNKNRYGKTLFSDKTNGRRPYLYKATDEEDEMTVALSRVKNWLNENKSDSEIAFIYRSNHQSRKIEEALREEGIPYILHGGSSFFDREEIKQCLSYLKLISNPKDDLSFIRCLGFPGKGIGDKSIQAMTELSNQKNISLFESSKSSDLKINSTATLALAEFHEGISNYKEEIKKLGVGEATKKYFESIGMQNAIIKAAKTEYQKERKELNYLEFLNTVELYSNRRSTKNPIRDFLDYAMLQSDKDKSSARVNLITAHGCKGLEFDLVLLIGLNDDNFPSQKSVFAGTLEEERRLFYVALTRAKKSLFLCYQSVCPAPHTTVI